MKNNETKIAKNTDSKEVRDEVQEKIDSNVIDPSDFTSLVVFGLTKDEKLLSMQKTENGEQFFNLLMNSFEAIKRNGGMANLRMIAKCVMLTMSGLGEIEDEE